MFANSEAILDAVGVLNALGPLPQAPSTYQSFTRDRGTVTGSKMRVARDQIAAKTRTAKCGEDRIFDDEFGEGYSVSPIVIYEALRKCAAAIEADSSGIVEDAIMRWLTTSQAKMYDSVIHADLVANDRPGIDGVPLFSASHPIVGTNTTKSNITSDALSQSSLDAMRSVMSKAVDGAGQPVNIVPDTLFVAPNLEATAIALIESSVRLQGVSTTGELDPSTGIIAAAAVTNVYQGLYTLIVDKRLPDNSWFLADLSQGGFWQLGHGRDGFRTAISDQNSYVRMHRGMNEWLLEETIYHGPGEWRFVAGNVTGAS